MNAMRVVCFHGRREIGGEDLFLNAARIFAGAANRAGFSAQVRTPGFPSPPGSPDRAVVKISRDQFADLAIPAEYDLEIVCDPLLAVVPPMGNALKPGGVLVLNTQNVIQGREIRIASLDLDAIASEHAATPEATHLGAALAGWETTDGGISTQNVIEAYMEISGEPMQEADEEALSEAVSATQRALNSG